MRALAFALSLALLCPTAVRAQDDEPVAVDEAGLVTMTLVDVPLAEALMQLADTADVSLVLPASTLEWVDLRVTARLRAVPLATAFDVLLKVCQLEGHFETAGETQVLLVDLSAEQALAMAQLELRHAEVVAHRAELQARVVERELDLRRLQEEEEDEDEDGEEEDENDEEQMDEDGHDHRRGPVQGDDGDWDEGEDEDEDEDERGEQLDEDEESSMAPLPAPRAAIVTPDARAASEAAVRDAAQQTQARDWRGAIESLTRAVELDPTRAQSHFDRGTLRLRTGAFVPGVLDLSRAVQLDPALGDPLFNRAYQLSGMVDLDQLRPELDRVVASDPNAAHVVFLRALFGAIRLELKGHDAAVEERTLEDLGRTLTLDPEHATALLVRSRLRVKAAARETTPKARHALLGGAHDDVAQVRRRHPQLPVAPFLEALVLSAMSGEPTPDAGDLRARAVAALQRAAELGLTQLADRVKAEPGFDPIRDEPALRALTTGL